MLRRSIPHPADPDIVFLGRVTAADELERRYLDGALNIGLTDLERAMRAELTAAYAIARARHLENEILSERLADIIPISSRRSSR